MKIFNWVHRRFTHKDADADGLSQNVKKVDDHNYMLTKEGDTHALLDNVVHLADLVDGWQGGVLAIGTFGLDSLNHILKEENRHQQYYCHYTVKDEEAFDEPEYDEYWVESDDQCEDQLDLQDDEEEGELNPLVNGLERSNSWDQAAAAASPTDDDHDATYKSNKWLPIDDHSYVMKKERITLADLFSAESDGNTNFTNSKNRNEGPQLKKLRKKPADTDDAAKRGQAFPNPKKLIAGIKGDSRPLKKLHQLMKRMLKRKIHPDAEANILKDSHGKLSGANGIPTDELWNNESASLLHIQEYGM